MTTRRTNNGNTTEKPYVDWSLIFIIIFLLGFGLIMVYSTSSYEASMSSKLNNDAAYYFRKQTYATLFGLLVMAVVSFVPYRFLARFSTAMYAGSLVLILLVLTPLGYEANGARRWLRLGVSVQPAEIAKAAIIFFIASMITKLGNQITTTRGFWFVMAWPALASLAVWRITENLSSAIIIFGIAFVMIFVASPDYKRLMTIVVAGIVGAVIMVLLVIQLAGKGFFGFRGARILAWIHPEEYASGKGFQTLQSLYAIGSGGIFGKGLGQSVQKLGFLPEAQNDMIFSVICEELGLFGGICIILLFAMLIWRLMIIAYNAQDLYGALLVIGVISHIAIQVVLNIAVVTNTIPNTGISLPFISYGGSSVAFLLAEIGVTLNVARGIKI